MVIDIQFSFVGGVSRSDAVWVETVFMYRGCFVVSCSIV
jgi:hypothetical protein